MKKILYITTISGFLPQFEKNDVEIMQNMGYEIHYASNLKKPIYTFDEKELKQQGIILHQIDIEKSPAKIIMNCRAIKQLIKIIDEENITAIQNAAASIGAEAVENILHSTPASIITPEVTNIIYAPLHICYSVGVDGISVAMLLLSSIIVFTGTFASWTELYYLW